MAGKERKRKEMRGFEEDGFFLGRQVARGEILRRELTEIFLKLVEEAGWFFRGSLEDIFLE